MAFKALVFGDSGTGKTVSIATLIKAGQKVRFLAAENNAIAGIDMGVKLLKANPTEGQLAVMIPERPKRNVAALLTQSEKFLTVPLEAQFKTADPNRKTYTRYLSVLKGLAKFQDTRNGVEYGDIGSWGSDTTLVVDGLTIICEAIKSAVIGGKLAVSQPEWGVMQNQLMDLIRMLTEDTECNLVLLAHPVKETDPVLGVQRIYPANLGQALNTLIPTAFTDVIWSERKGTTFTWNTDHKQAVTRTTHLPIKDSLPQDYSQFFPKN
jgi:hypothetical protein